MDWISSHFLVVLIAIGAVALLVLGYSITWFFRGRHIQTDVGDNENMRRLGLRCTTQQILDDEAALRGVSPDTLSAGCATKNCADCAEKHTENQLVIEFPGHKKE